MKRPIVSLSVDDIGGTVVVHGTREPVQAVRDYLHNMDSVDDFLEGLPTVTREPVVVFVENPVC